MRLGVSLVFVDSTALFLPVCVKLSEKSGRLQQLKAALKAMEQQMISVQMAQVDENLRKSTFEEQVVLDQRLKAAEKEKKSLNQKLVKVRRPALGVSETSR